MKRALFQFRKLFYSVSHRAISPRAIFSTNRFPLQTRFHSNVPTQEEISPNDRMIIGFTCKVCSTRSYKQMSKLAYTKGVVLMKCDGCKNVHLIADHLGWFDSQKKAGTIEDILREKGEQVQRVRFDPTKSVDGVSQQDGDMLEWLPKVMESLSEKK
jgi:protein import protein ZIM17